jgi:hypothetical protein
MQRIELIFIVIIVIVIFYFWMSKSDTGIYGSIPNYYDTLTEKLNAKLERDTKFLIIKYLDPEYDQYNLPTLSELQTLQQTNPESFLNLKKDGTVKKVINVKALNTWLLLGSNSLPNFEFFMNRVNELVPRLQEDLSQIENVLKTLIQT